MFGLVFDQIVITGVNTGSVSTKLVWILNFNKKSQNTILNGIRLNIFNKIQIDNYINLYNYKVV